MTVAAGLPTSFAVTGAVGIPLLYVVLGVLPAVFTGGYAATSRSIANASAFYAYVTHGLGRITMQIGLYGLFGFVTADLLKAKTGIDLPWWTVALGGGLRSWQSLASGASTERSCPRCAARGRVFDIAQPARAPSGVRHHRRLLRVHCLGRDRRHRAI